MRSVRAALAIVGFLAGLLVLAAAPGAAFAIWPPVEGPAWWTGNFSSTEATAHTFSGEIPIEATAINATSASFIAYVKPIAGAPVTYFNMWVSNGPECRWALKDGREGYVQCVKNGKEIELSTYEIATGEIVGGNPEEYVAVTGSTLNGGYTTGEWFRHQEQGAPLGERIPVELVPGHVYTAGIGITRFPHSYEESWRLDAEPWLFDPPWAGSLSIFTPGPPVSNARLKREARQKEKKEKQEERLKEREAR